MIFILTQAAEDEDTSEAPHLREMTTLEAAFEKLEQELLEVSFFPAKKTSTAFCFVKLESSLYIIMRSIELTRKLTGLPRLRPW